MKRGLVALLCVGTLLPLAATAQAGPPRRSPPPQRSRYYGPQKSGGHHHANDGWFAFGLGVLFGAAVEALTEPPPPPPPPVVVAYPPPPIVYGPPPPQAYATAPQGLPPGGRHEAPGAVAPYGGPPPASWTSPLTPTDSGSAQTRAAEGTTAQDAPPEEDPCCPGADWQRVFVPPQTVWREERVVEPARYAVRLVPVFEDVREPVFTDVVENGVVKTVLVGSRLAQRQVGTREERVVVRPETVRVEHVAEVVPGRWAYVPASAITDIAPPTR